tara:strand:+ start:593 stop:775 length:183 start_codon:yes stop_codon:yes gene_type:complete
MILQSCFNGTSENARVVKSFGAGCDEEALRIINSIQGFIPEKEQDQEVKAKMILPVTFKL